jgi:poly(A) polymerase
MKVTQKPSLHASWIDPFAKEIVERLQRSGFTSYLVGGCVRDLLVGIHPKDFDIATSASPQEVKKKVYGSYIIGKRFRLVLVKRGDQQYEVATFRRESTPEDFENLDEGEATPSADNFFGTPEQDALRRDFTINALFYDPIKNELIDYAKGVADIESGTLRMIGDPLLRIQEDSIRALRAIRLSHRIGFQMEESLRDAISKSAEAVSQSKMPRRREEYLKIMRLHEPALALLELYDLGLMKVLMPLLFEIFESTETREIFLSYMYRWNEMVLDPANPIEIYTALVWAFSSSLGGAKDREDKIDSFMRDELGVFKGESMGVESVFQVQRYLRDVETFKKRGHRRQQAFLKSPEVPMALRLAGIDYLLPTADFRFWQQALEHYYQQPAYQAPAHP